MKSNFKAIFLSLLTRRLRRDGGAIDLRKDAAARSMTGTKQPESDDEESLKVMEPGGTAASVQADASSETERRLPEKEAVTREGPPEDWIGGRSSGPPAHWIERVREVAPELLRGDGNAEPESRSDAPALLRRKQAAPPMRLERPVTQQSLQQDPPGRRRLNRSNADLRDERRPGDLSPDAPKGPLTETESQSGDLSRFKSVTRETTLSSPSVKPPRRAAQTEETPQAGEAEPAIRPALSTDPQEPLKPGEDRIVRQAPEPRIAQAGPKPPGGESGKDRAIRKERSRESVGPNEPPAATPVKIIEWKGPARVEPRLKATTPRGSDLDQPISIRSNKDAVRYSEVTPPQAAKQTPRQSGKELTSGAGVNSGQAGKGVTRYPDVADRKKHSDRTRRRRSASGSGYRDRAGKEEKLTGAIESPVAEEQQSVSFGAPSDRWPELMGALAADQFDDVMAVRRELNHHRRLTIEQTGREPIGDIWSE